MCARRSKTGGTLFHAEHQGAWFTVGVFKEQVSVQWRLGPAPVPSLRRLRAARSLLRWTTLRFSFAAGALRGDPLAFLAVYVYTCPMTNIL